MLIYLLALLGGVLTILSPCRRFPLRDLFPATSSHSGSATVR
jgi:cytochrome c biogenesis protein CcdA